MQVVLRGPADSRAQTLCLDTVGTARGSGWVHAQLNVRHRVCLLRTHPLPRAVLTVSKFASGTRRASTELAVAIVNGKRT
jgi:hypothetical protein